MVETNYNPYSLEGKTILVTGASWVTGTNMVIDGGLALR